MELYQRKKLPSLFNNSTLVTLDGQVWDGPSSNLRHYLRKKKNPFRSSLIPAPNIHAAAAAAPSFIQIL
jgi:hypothetical protein